MKLKKYLKGNKKVRNATKCVYDSIEFKSKLELFCYRYAKGLGYDLQYEDFQTTLMQGFHLEGYLYQPDRTNKIVLNKRKILGMTYSPDFHTTIKNRNGEDVKIVIECKGNPNDAYPLKKKLFLQVCDKFYKDKFYFFEPHSQKQIKECFEIIKTIQE